VYDILNDYSFFVSVTDKYVDDWAWI